MSIHPEFPHQREIQETRHLPINYLMHFVEISGGKSSFGFAVQDVSDSVQALTLPSLFLREHRQVQTYSNPPCTGKYIFSNPLVDVEWIKNGKFLPVAMEAVDWNFEITKSFPLRVNWIVDDAPINMYL